MRYLLEPTTDPYWNLAAEEFLLTGIDQPVFRLWRNSPAVIVGRNQNTIAQVNMEYVQQHALPVVRRLSGGGAVFHDLGNINYTFIDKAPEGMDTAQLFARFTRPILDFLSTLGIQAALEGRNDLTIDGHKFSGNAIAVHKDRVLMHGTLLFRTAVQHMGQVLTPKQRTEVVTDNAVQSRPAHVCNIGEHLPAAWAAMDTETFMQRLMDFVVRQERAAQDNPQSPYTTAEQDAIEQLRLQKYTTYAWNFGKSPAYTFHGKHRFEGGNLEIYLEVKQGYITQARIFGDYFCTQPTEAIERALAGCAHTTKAMAQCLEPFAFDQYFAGITLPQFLYCASNNSSILTAQSATGVPGPNMASAPLS